MNTRREDILEATCNLLEIQGYHATGVNQILEASGAPRGSLYYYFPEGKEGLAVEAVARIGASIADRIRHGLASDADPAQAVHNLIMTIAAQVEASAFRSGSPLAAVAMEAASTNDRLNEACRDAFALWQQVVAERLLEAGFDPEGARRLGGTIIATIEGATMLSRSARTAEPLRGAAEELRRLIALTQYR